MQVHQRDVVIAVGGRLLEGTLCVPESAVGLVLMAPGKGSSRFSPRHVPVARALHGVGLATLLVDLLTADEESTARSTLDVRFVVELLAGRLMAALGWVGRDEQVYGLPVGLYGSGIGAAAALVVAARAPNDVFAVVSRGGRPDLARDVLPDVLVPTLLIVGGADAPGLEVNEEALRLLGGRKELRAIPGATSLLEERGAMDEVARLTTEWLSTYVRGAAGPEVRGWVDPAGSVP
jgi:dienelactone hydrolase